MINAESNVNKRPACLVVLRFRIRVSTKQVVPLTKTRDAFIAVFTKIGAGAFSLSILIILFIFSNPILDLQHLKYATDPLESYTVMMVEVSIFN